MNTTTPDPFGSNSISPLLVLVMSCPFTSNAPPNCGVVSDTTSEIPPVAEVTFASEIFFKPPSAS